MSLRTLVRHLSFPIAAALLTAASSAFASPYASITFSPNPIVQGQAVRLAIGIADNTGATLTGVTLPSGQFTYPTGLANADTTLNPPYNGCGGTLTVSTASNTISLAGATATSGFCQIFVWLDTPVAGSFPTTINAGAITTDQGPTIVSWSDTLTVDPTLLVTNTADSGAGSLRDAITFANNNCVGPYVIAFKIASPPYVIQPASPLPPITCNNTTIDGYSQGGTTRNDLSASSNNATIAIQLDGVSCGPCSGLVLLASGVIQGLSIHSFQQYGIDVQNGFASVLGNYMGVDPSGAAKPNGYGGIHVATFSAQIGSAAASDANVVGANLIGILVDGNATIEGNQVGGLPSGAPGNGNGVGIRVNGQATINDNVVRYSTGGPGIAITTTFRVLTAANSSFANAGPGIDINEDGPTPNDESGPPYDTDGILNYPVITSVQPSPTGTLVEGYVKTISLSFGTYTAEFYANTVLRGTSEGETYLAAFPIPLDANGFGTFSFTFAGEQHHIAAAATACADGCIGSSEYSFPSVAALAISPAAVTFPDRPVNTSSAPVDVTISNAGNETMTISSITATGDFTLTSSCPSSLAAGDSCVASVTFKPLVLGARSGALTVATDAPSGTQSVRLTGNGLASTDRGILDVSPGLLDFDRIPVGTRSATQLVTLSNSGVLTINLVVSTVGDFSRVPVPSGATDCGATLAPREVCEIAIVFTPSLPGAMSGKLVLDSDASNPHVEVSLFGTGAQPAAPAHALVLPDHVSFGTLPVGLRSPATSMILTNATRQPLAITELTIAGDFSIGDSCTTVPAGGTCSISLFFTPSARGARTGTLTLRASGDPYVVALDGVGGANISPVLSVSPLRIGFGNAVIGPASASTSIELRNIGEVPVELASPPNLGEFLVTSHCLSALAPGGRCTMDIAFFPRVQGLRAAQLDIRSNAVNGPHRVELSGVGCSLPNAARSRIPELVCSP